jgi:uncharacterized protein YndB with AHSA1/START domain
MHAQVETYESLPPIHTFSFNLHPVYDRVTAARHVIVEPRQADLRFTFDLPVPPAEAWEWLNDPGRRTRWEGQPVEAARGTAGQRGVGTASHCLHGSKVRVIQTVLDWRPFDYFTYESRSPAARQPESIATVLLHPTLTGTAIDFRIRVTMRPRLVGVLMYRLMATPEFRRGIAKLGQLVQPTPA